MAQHVEVSMIGDVVVVRFLHDLQWHAPTMIGEVRTLRNLLETTDAKAIVLNLGEVQFLPAAGLNILVLLQRQVQARGIALRLCNVQPMVREVFEICKLNRLFTIADDEADAEAALGQANRNESALTDTKNAPLPNAGTPQQPPPKAGLWPQTSIAVVIAGMGAFFGMLIADEFGDYDLVGAVGGSLLCGMLVFALHLARIGGDRDKKPDELGRVLAIYAAALVLIGVLVWWLFLQLVIRFVTFH